MRLAPARARSVRGAHLFWRFRPAAIAVSTGVLLAGCGALGGNNSADLSGSGGAAITVAAVPGIGDTPLYVASKTGLFKQRGLTVTIKSYTSLRQEVEALNTGQVDIGAGDYTNFLTGDPQKIADHLRIVADGYDAATSVMEVLTLPDSSIKTPSDLQGATIATPPAEAVAQNPKKPYKPYNIETLATQAVLRNDSVSITSIKWTAMPAAKEVSALQHHTVDAILVTEPYLFEAESQLGAVSVLDACSGVTAGLPLLGYFTTSAYADSHGAAVQAFRSALLEAQTNASARGPIQTMLSSAAGVRTADAPLITLGNYPTFLSIGQVQRVADLMYDGGMISTSLRVRQLIAH